LKWAAEYLCLGLIIYTKTSPTTGTVTVYNVAGEIYITAADAPIPAQNYTISLKTES
jgi:hypothetical protein